MSNISSAYINAILADAAYIDLNTGVIDAENMQTGDDLPKRMTPPLAKFIADNLEVISNEYKNDFPGLGSGFDAIVWKGRKGTPYEGKVFVSTRGTQPGEDMFGADLDLALSSSAHSQIIDMVNWWLRETTPATETVRQLVNIPTPTGVPIPSPLSLVVPGLPAQGTGRLTGVNSISINGHSLGGHLASAFARILEAASP